MKYLLNKKCILKFFGLIQIYKCLEVDLITDTPIIVVGNSNVSRLFIYEVQSMGCNSQPIYYEHNNNTKFIVSNYESLDITSINSISDVFITRNINQLNSTHKELIINHECLNRDIMHDVLNVTIDNISFQYVKLCKEQTFLNTLPSLLLLFITAILIVFLSTYSDLKVEYTDIRQDGEIKTKHIYVFILLGSAVLVSIFYFRQYINIIFSAIVLFQSGMSLYLTFKIFLDAKINKYISGIVKDILVYIIIGLIISAYFITKHWVLNNIIGFSLVFTIMSLFHIKNLKICSILLLSAFVYDSFWVYVSPYIFKRNVMVIAATSIDLPIKFEFPIFFNNPMNRCMYLGLGDLVLPGFTLKFCKRFDFLKRKTLYYKWSILFYIMALFTSLLAILYFNSPQPVLFYMCPFLLIGISTIAYKHHDNDIWYAEKVEDFIIAYGAVSETKVQQVDITE
jgi:hypothetical protein